MPTNELTLYQVDAFATQVFSGNPAAVCFLEEWLSEETMQAIAAENNVAETAFLVADSTAADTGFTIRWFTPTVEIPLCGHATLASAHVLFEHLNRQTFDIVFHSLSGDLSVTRKPNGYQLKLPAFAAEEVSIDASLEQAIGNKVIAQYQGNYPMAVLENAEAVELASPNLAAVQDLTDGGCLVITAAGDDVDFVSRFFGPGVGIDEDPVTGSAHCLLTPFWITKLGKPELHARQLSARGGDLQCSLSGNQVLLTGQCVTYLVGKIYIR